MKISNVRLGFATNSSSTHSVILSSKTMPHGFSENDSAIIEKEYGWSNFMIKDKEQKLFYLAAQLFSNLSSEFPLWQMKSITKALFEGTKIENFIDVLNDKYGFYVDHQSCFSMPWMDKEIFPKIFAEYMTFFSDPNIVILGGSDNDVYRDIDSDFGFSEDDCLRIKKDGNAYTIFNIINGTKIRLTVDGSAYEKASVPELVDLKITDRCPYKCSFCYQSSLPEGKEGDIREIDNIIKALGVNNLGVLEIALGGGEPTAYDNFSNVVENIYENGMSPNFTTFAVDWLNDKRKVKAASLCGGIGVSVRYAKDVEQKVHKIREATGKNYNSIVAQHVFGSAPPSAVINLLKTCKETYTPLLLLGFKDVGFGTNFKKHDMSPVLEEIKKYPSMIPSRLSVDTAFASQHVDFLHDMHVNKMTYSVKEGDFSLYIDAVEKTIAPSSYCSPKEKIPLEEVDGKTFFDKTPAKKLAEEIKEKFSNF